MLWGRTARASCFSRMVYVRLYIKTSVEICLIRVEIC